MNLLSRDDFDTLHPARVRSATTLPVDQSVVLKGDLSVFSDVSLRGVVSGDVTVRSGVQLSFHGVIKGSLTVQQGATAYVYGVIKRDLRLEGSALIDGVVQGNVRCESSGALHISGVVKGRIIE